MRDGRNIYVLTVRTDADALEALRRFAARCRQPETDWRPVADTPTARKLWLDFYDVTTDSYGQCRGVWETDAPTRDGWHQCPLGVAPVLLCLVRRRRGSEQDCVLRFEEPSP